MTEASTHQGFDPAQLSAQVAYQLLVTCVAPRPIAFVSTRSADGIPNLAPFSYFMAGGSNPLSVAFSPNTKADLEPKDTLRNIQTTGEYTINVVSYNMVERMNITAAGFAYGTSEWERAGFLPAPSSKVTPDRVVESLLSMECRLYQIVPHGVGASAANYVIGEVVYFHVATDLIIDGEIDHTRVDYVARLGKDWYARANANSMFELPRPPQPS
jgi:flavin reductase (DIM6/NTAB) family NADH-FMN oxidoreductase RutF